MFFCSNSRHLTSPTTARANDEVEDWEDYNEDPRDHRGYYYRQASRKSLILPIAVAIFFALEMLLLLNSWSAARKPHGGVFRDVPIFFLAAFPYAAMIGIGLMIRRHRSLQIGLLPVLIIMALPGLWAAADINRHSRGGFEILGKVLAYLFQWAMVGLGLLIGFVALATKRR